MSNSKSILLILGAFYTTVLTTKCHPLSSSEPGGLCSAQLCIIKEIDLFNSLLTERSIFSILFTFWYIKLYTKQNRNLPSKLLEYSSLQIESLVKESRLVELLRCTVLIYLAHLVQQQI